MTSKYIPIRPSTLTLLKDQIGTQTYDQWVLKQLGVAPIETKRTRKRVPAFRHKTWRLWALGPGESATLERFNPDGTRDDEGQRSLWRAYLYVKRLHPERTFEHVTTALIITIIRRS